MTETPNNLKDYELVNLILAGQIQVYEELIKRYQAYVFHIVSRHAPYDKVEEISHEAFVRAYKSLAGFSVKESFKQWLASITVRSCYDFWREQAKRKEVLESTISKEGENWLEQAFHEDSLEASEANVRQREAREILELALAKLSAANRMVLTLIHIEGYSVEEVASALGWSQAKVKVRAFRARKEMQNIIRRLMPDGEL